MDDGWRRNGGDELRAAVVDALGADVEVALLLVDLDQFLWFNDTFSHAEGDCAIARVWSCLAAFGAPLYRTGGDQFSVLITGAAARDAPALAEAMRAAVQALAIPNPGPPRGPGCLTISIGIARRAAGVGDPDALIARADHACYAAKAAGRNQVSA
jgi:diguanylate cyclase (GGDEF)-like protein